ncbi:hypothetical protein, partial [Klebsiella pneumoniae]|uniref:hypothetical protein n=2 Tax=Gammaproteobacteria TaxID=1236 RepID=UPI0024DEEBFE
RGRSDDHGFFQGSVNLPALPSFPPPAPAGGDRRQTKRCTKGPAVEQDSACAGDRWSCPMALAKATRAIISG